MTSNKKVKYKLNNSGEFVINNYNSSKLFSSFFPGVAGKNGIPMWAFYVNRGQCVCSIGLEGKHNPIMEFLPANWAYNLTSTQGFRTFLKFSDGSFYEPFQDHYQNRNMRLKQKMKITSSKLTLVEKNKTLGLQFSVEYFNVPQDKFAGLIRKLKIKNLNDKAIDLEGLDGLPMIVPYGINNFGLKNLRRLFEAFVEVVNHENKAPFFKSKVLPSDTPDVIKVKKGNFYLAFESEDSTSKLLTPIVDPVKVFGIRGDYNYPENFLAKTYDEIADNQILENRLPCAMGRFKRRIAPHSEYEVTTIIGQAASVEELNLLIPTISKNSYVNKKDAENRRIIRELTQNNFILSDDPIFNNYARTNFLDNALRGGFPFSFKGKEKTTTLHLYSRKHGDLERDYNDFRLKATQYSQGNGNYRDVNQNRRSDLFFNPDVKESNLIQFYNLIQLDGFNPLVIKEIRFTIQDKVKLSSVLSKYLNCDDCSAILDFLKKPFTPGEFMEYLKESTLDLPKTTDDFMGEILECCHKEYGTEHGEGYWTDHWTYNLDLLENYLAVYPENKKSILFEDKVFTFYDNPHTVKPRDEKYVIWNDRPMQLDSVALDTEKENLIGQRESNPNLVRTGYGTKEIYHTNLLNKMLNIVINKLTSLDSEGVGVEMESDKPNWYDALNGLPGIIGSSLNETLEIKRNIQFLIESLDEFYDINASFAIFTEMYDFINSYISLTKHKLNAFDFWDNASSLKEEYRKRTRLGISGEEVYVKKSYLMDFLNAGLDKLNLAIEKAWDKEKGIISSYFVNEIEDYHIIEEGKGNTKTPKTSPKGFLCYKVTKFRHRALPLFLEGPVHYLRSNKNIEKSRQLVKNIRQSGLYDRKLNMYKVNECLDTEPDEIGRARTFSPGWFENESIWLHMEYKYILEMLKSGLYEDFFHDFKKVLIPFLKPEMYGRSILENSSFIVSSANPDPDIHGGGYVARLSGATAEFINILLIMIQGKTPFTLNNQLEFSLSPVLPSWLFTNEEKRVKLYKNGKLEEEFVDKDSFSFIFLGKILVTYHNPQRKNTYGQDKAKITSYKITFLNGSEKTYNDSKLSGDIVEAIRDRQVEKIYVTLK